MSIKLAGLLCFYTNSTNVSKFHPLEVMGRCSIKQAGSTLNYVTYIYMYIYIKNSYENRMENSFE